MYASLLEMSDFGGTDAESLQRGINSIFDASSGTLKVEDYNTKVVGMTADGASVNFGHLSGLMRGWIRSADG